MDNKDKIIQQKMQAHSVKNYDTESGWKKMQPLLQKKKAKRFMLWKPIAAAVSAVVLGTFGWRYLFRQHTIIVGMPANNIVIHSEKNDTATQPITNTVLNPVHIRSEKSLKNIVAKTGKTSHRTTPAKQANSIVTDSIHIIISQSQDEKLLAKNNETIDKKQMNIITENSNAQKPLPVISINEIAGAAQVLNESTPKRHKNLLEKISSVQQINNTAGYSVINNFKIPF